MPKKKTRLNPKLLYFGAAGVLILFWLALELTGVTHLFHKQSVPPVIPSHKSATASSNKSVDQPAPSPTPPSSTVPTPPSSENVEHTLIAPFGNFVSNHFPGQNNSPTTEASICNTSPGATCYIEFTNSDSQQTTKLASQIADDHGSTSWYWDVNQDAHLTSGKWHVTAVSSLGSQTKSTSDTLDLTIQ